MLQQEASGFGTDIPSSMCMSPTHTITLSGTRSWSNVVDPQEGKEEEIFTCMSWNITEFHSLSLLDGWPSIKGDHCYKKMVCPAPFK